MISKLLQVAGVLLLTMCSCSYLRKFFYKPDPNKTQYITDKTNRIVIYHGVNVSNFSKSAPDFLPWQTKEDFARLKTWGFNLVRYLVFWEAIEPVKGTYDEVYIKQTRDRLKWLQELGIDVIIDVHQDIYAKKFTGNGFPSWTIHDEGLKFTPRTPWNMNYFEPAVIASYNYFWKSMELKTAYINMLKFLMVQFDPMDNVIGFDVMNEPFLGTIPSFEKKTLTEFYTNIQAMMLAGNFKSEMCFEPMMYTSAGLPTDLRFVPLRDNLYFPHYYDAFCHEGKSYTSLNKAIMTRAMAIKQREAQNFNSPLLIGEFGISSAVGGYTQYLKDFVSAANEWLFGFTYYTFDKKSMDDYGIINDDGTPTGQLNAIVSVYPQKIAGRNPIVKSTGNSFILEYETDPSITGSTEIFIPESFQKVVIQINGVNFSYQSGQLFTYNNNGDKNQHVQISWL
jgi:endoglycosylceramidase